MQDMIPKPPKKGKRSNTIRNQGEKYGRSLRQVSINKSEIECEDEIDVIRLQKSTSTTNKHFTTYKVPLLSPTYINELKNKVKFNKNVATSRLGPSNYIYENEKLRLENSIYQQKFNKMQLQARINHLKRTENKLMKQAEIKVIYL